MSAKERPAKLSKWEWNPVTPDPLAPVSSSAVSVPQKPLSLLVVSDRDSRATGEWARTVSVVPAVPRRRWRRSGLGRPFPI